MTKSENKNKKHHSCPKCDSNKHRVLGVDEWSKDDITTYMACKNCNLVFWFNTHLNKISTNRREWNGNL